MTGKRLTLDVTVGYGGEMSEFGTWKLRVG